MKKTLIALAALAAFGSAYADGMAPTTITPYARLDIGMGDQKTDGQFDPGLHAINGGYNTNTFGFKADQDIGGGSKVFGKAEIGFGPSNAAGWAANSWGRTGIVGLSGGWGAVQLGMDWSPYDNAVNEAMDYNHFSALSWAWNGGGVHADNGNDPTGNGVVTGHIQYTRPTFSGFNASLMYAPSKDKTTGNDTSYTSAAGNYNAGPLALTVAYEHVPTSVNALAIPNSGTGPAITDNAAAAGDGSYTNSYLGTAAYNFGAATVFLALESAKANGVLGSGNGSATDTGTAIGIKVPLGDNTLSAGWANENTSGDVNNKRTAYSIQVLHALNKTASVYAGYVTAKDNTLTTSNATQADIATTRYAVGLTLSF